MAAGRGRAYEGMLELDVGIDRGGRGSEMNVGWVESGRGWSAGSNGRNQQRPGRVHAANIPEPKKISTSVSRGSRREEWRKSKGMDARPKLQGQNKLGRPISRHKAVSRLRRDWWASGE